MITTTLIEDKLLSKIKILSDSIWDGKIQAPNVEEWLTNFSSSAHGTEQERRLHALYLLSQFMYFGSRQMRELMRVLYRDLYKYPIIEGIRRRNNDTTDLRFINQEFNNALEQTMFLGIGNPSESGCHLLYYFRQENGLPKTRFIHSHEIFTRGAAPIAGQPVTLTLRKPSIERYIFIDDFCGSGHQGRAYSRDIVEHIKSFNPQIQVMYFVLCGTTKGLDLIRSDTVFDVVESVFELDDSFRCFSSSSRYFPSDWPAEITPQFAEQLCREFGNILEPSAPLGFGNCQLLLGFQHNTPDNTLPILWYDEPGTVEWIPIFRRYPKIYS